MCIQEGRRIPNECSMGPIVPIWKRKGKVLGRHHTTQLRIGTVGERFRRKDREKSR